MEPKTAAGVIDAATAGGTAELVLAALQSAGFAVVPSSQEVRTRVGYALYDHLGDKLSFQQIEDAANAVMRQLAMCGMEVV